MGRSATSLFDDGEFPCVPFFINFPFESFDGDESRFFEESRVTQPIANLFGDG